MPIAIRKRGGRKVVLGPGGAPDSRMLTCRGPDNAMIKAIARAFRWRIDHGYVGRILRLTLLAPDIVEAIVVGRQPGMMTLAVLMQAFPMDWKTQRAKLG